MRIKNGLVSYWKLDESSGNAIDSHGGYDGTVYGCTQGVTGKINTAYSFDDDYITRAKIPLDESPFSICLWVKYEIKLDGEDPHQIIGLNWNWTNYQGYGYQILHVNGANGRQRITCARTSTYSDSVVPSGGWHHIAVTHDGTNVRFYLDGVADGGGTNSLYPDSPTLYFGKESSSSGWRDFKGLMDEIGLWSRALSPAEITHLYNDGKGLPYPFLIGPFPTHLRI